ncbi:MAG: DNA sulfur modification protein DndB [Crenarchaeota archaeon]|nr:DNA sulfur modification protein DndB [Thermoproteota archaeon]
MSKIRADERSVGSQQYGFDAIRGNQAGREFYVVMCSFKMIPKIFVFNDEFVPPEMRAQRILRDTRIPTLKNYIINNRKDYIFSSLTASVDGIMKFVPTPGTDVQDEKTGRLYINMEATFLINDGQHRRRAIEQALKEYPDLAHEMISVVFFRDIGLKRSQQMFADLNKNAVKPTKSLNILYDHRDNFSQFIVRLITSIEIFQGRVELEKTTISNRSKTFFTLSGVSDSTMALLGINKGRKVTEDETKTIKDFWNEVSKNIPEWQLLIQGKVTSGELRKNYVNAHTNLLNALGIVGNILINEYPKDWKEQIRGLGKIDWSRDNAEWEGRLLQKGRMLKNRLGVELAVNTILEYCGVKLSQDRLEFEKRK